MKNYFTGVCDATAIICGVSLVYMDSLMGYVILGMMVLSAILRKLMQ